MDVTIVLPVKKLSSAKSRLEPVLSADDRRCLVLDMFSHVLSVCVSALDPIRVLVVSCDEIVGERAANAGASWIRDPEAGLNRSLVAVFEACWRRDETPLYLPCDLPRLETADIRAIVAAGSDERVVLCSSRDGAGTNALMVPPKTPMDPELGAGSFERHLAIATALGYEVVVCELPRVAFDVDTPADWADLHAVSAGPVTTL